MFTYNWAIHRGTLMSRDVAPAEIHETRRSIIEKYEKDKKWFKSIGYMFWFAEIKHPDGSKETLESNPYR